MLGAVTFGHKSFQPVIEAIIELAETCAKEPWSLAEPPARQGGDRGATARSGRPADRGRLPRARQAGRAATSSTPPRRSAAALFEDEAERALALKLFKDIEKEIVRGAILRDGQRIDGRDTKTVRPIDCRGRAAAARPRLGAVHPRRDPGDRGRDARHRPGRADHRRARRRVPRKLHAALQFPALLDRRGRAAWGRPAGARSATASSPGARCGRCCRRRRASPTRSASSRRSPSSNGSSSMASVCGASLALMDAGVPLARPVAGIAMGLIKEPDGFAVLSDILGDEDHLGDMDFKVAGTERGITALQMDIKITSITEEIMRVALDQARDGRGHILGEMAKALTGARDEVSENAPRITTIHDPQGQDPRGHRLGRQGDPRDHRDDRRQDRHRRRRHDQGRRGRRQRRQGGDRLDPRHRRRAGGRASSTPARSSRSSISAPS